MDQRGKERNHFRLLCALSLSLPCGHKSTLFSQQHVCDVSAPVGPFENQHPGVLLGAAHKGTFCLARTRVSGSQEESRCSLSHMAFIISLGTVSQPYQFGEGGNPPRARLLVATREPTLQAGLPKDSSLRYSAQGTGRFPCFLPSHAVMKISFIMKCSSKQLL